MPISTSEAVKLLDSWYPPKQSNIHGRLYASRITAFIPTLVDFFKENKELVPKEFQQELANLSDADLENWQRVALLRASGRKVSETTFEDKGSGKDFAVAGQRNCSAYLQQKGVPADKAAILAQAIVEADPANPKEKPKSLLGWILKHATQLETLRDQRNKVGHADKTVSITQLPAWEQAKNDKKLSGKLKNLAQTHYQLIANQQGFTCVGLTDEHGQRLYPRSIDDEASSKVQQGKTKIHRAGLDSLSCFENTLKATQNHHGPTRPLSTLTTPVSSTVKTTIVPPPLGVTSPSIQRQASPQSTYSATRAKDWGKVRSRPEATTIQRPSTFQLVDNAQPITLEQVEELLKVKKVPLAPMGNGTMLDVCLKAPDQKQRGRAADLFATYAVKQVMDQFDTNVSVKMVDNNQATSTSKKHDRHAMKVSFSSQEEAQAFSDKLFKQYGIHSYTFGAGTPKTPQNGSIFLTQNDLEKIAQTSKITLEPGSGARAYATKAYAFEEAKTVDRTLDIRDDVSSTMRPLH